MKRIKRILSLAVLSGPLVFPFAWTDRAEYDLVLQIHADASPKKQLALLDQWKAKYPKSSMDEARQELYLAAYRAQDDLPHMFAVAHAMVASDPANMVGLYWSTLLGPSTKDAGPDTLAFIDAAAKGVLANCEKYFSAQNRPSSVSEADWTKQSNEFEFAAHRALGWTAWQRNQLDDAAKELSAAVKIDPQNAEASEWLGTVLLQQSNTRQDSAALWHLAYAASVKGDDALPDADRGQVTTALDRIYKREKGDLNGLDQIKAMAAASPFPPDDFNLSPLAGASDTDSAPNVAVWKALKQRLSASDGSAYFDSMLKGKQLPIFKGHLVRCKPLSKPSQIAVALGDDPADEVLLQLSSPLPTSAKPGTEIEFTAVADSFDANPFHLTLAADPDEVSGWPNAPAHRTTAKKSATP